MRSIYDVSVNVDRALLYSIKRSHGTTITGRFERRPVSMEEAGRNRNNMSHRTKHTYLQQPVRSYIVHPLSTYVSGTIRRNCRPWMTRSDGFAPSSLDAYRISRQRNRQLILINSAIDPKLYLKQFSTEIRVDISKTNSQKIVRNKIFCCINAAKLSGRFATMSVFTRINQTSCERFAISLLFRDNQLFFPRFFYCSRNFRVYVLRDKIYTWFRSFSYLLIFFFLFFKREASCAKLVLKRTRVRYHARCDSRWLFLRKCRGTIVGNVSHLRRRMYHVKQLRRRSGNSTYRKLPAVGRAQADRRHGLDRDRIGKGAGLTSVGIRVQNGGPGG
ncbi:hypothetical protein PUN28_006774 [Cardiocondyla obscurior]|uniref:Uncharacterized protein n=1 Tax=Cardiocondyla obscurior TaxID=286306 RepID=A0AAW2G4P1_9HYME